MFWSKETEAQLRARLASSILQAIQTAPNLAVDGKAALGCLDSKAQHGRPRTKNVDNLAGGAALLHHYGNLAEWIRQRRDVVSAYLELHSGCGYLYCHRNLTSRAEHRELIDEVVQAIQIHNQQQGATIPVIVHARGGADHLLSGSKFWHYIWLIWHSRKYNYKLVW